MFLWWIWEYISGPQTSFAKDANAFKTRVVLGFKCQERTLQVFVLASSLQLQGSPQLDSWSMSTCSKKKAEFQEKVGCWGLLVTTC